MQAAPPYLGGFGGSARTEHGPLIPQPSPEHRIHAKTPSSSPKPPCRPSARRALGTHCACAALRRHFGRCRSGPPRGRPPAEAAPGGVPQPLGVPRAPCPGTPRWGCGAARPAPLRLVAAGGACWSPSLAAGARWQAPVCGGSKVVSTESSLFLSTDDKHLLIKIVQTGTKKSAVNLCDRFQELPPD